MSELRDHADCVMGRVRYLLRLHSPDLLLAFEGIVLMDLVRPMAGVPVIPHEVEPPSVNVTPVVVETLEVPNESKNGTTGLVRPIDQPSPRIDKPLEVVPPIHVEPATVDGKPPEVPPILQRPVVPPREHVETVTECSVDVDGKSIEELIAGAPNLSSPHDPEKMVQLVRAMIDDPLGTNSGPFVSKFLCIAVQGTHWVLRWVRYHAEVLPSLKNYQKSEYLQKLLLDRQRVKRVPA